MIFLEIAAGLLALVGSSPFVAVRVIIARRRARHAVCLQRIDALERELYPEYFTSPAAKQPAARPRGLAHDFGEGFAEGLSLRPGVRWPVKGHNYVQVIGAPAISQSSSSSIAAAAVAQAQALERMMLFPHTNEQLRALNTKAIMRNHEVWLPGDPLPKPR